MLGSHTLCLSHSSYLSWCLPSADMNSVNIWSWLLLQDDLVDEPEMVAKMYGQDLSSPTPDDAAEVSLVALTSVSLLV